MFQWEKAVPTSIQSILQRETMLTIKEPERRFRVGKLDYKGECLCFK
jgi:hypothetical protein